jgi:hypothetical protein
MSRPTPTAMLQPLPATRLHGTVGPVGEALHAPASGQPCVHWRLRIFEHVAPGMEFVHEVTSSDPLEISYRGDPAEPMMRVRLAPDNARIQAIPTLFRVGSPGALAVAQQFGMRGAVRVEEVLLRPGELIEAEGVLSDPSAALSRGPFRTIDAPLELMQATLRVEAGSSLRPVILPWALSMAAILAGTAGAATALLHWWDVQHRSPTLPLPGAAAPDIGPKRLPHPRWP